MNDKELRHRAAMTDAALDAYRRLRRENTALRTQMAQLETENANLRRQLRTSTARYRRLQQAYSDALLMLAFELVGLAPSRRRMAPELMSLRRWDRARALLQVARLHDGRRWRTTDEQTVIDGLAAAVKANAIDDTRIKMRLPRR